ncbi:hypothetical protein WA026_017661 [Henosepilachna vigintioctopunctata]|uniref:Uncharacterized protein n=1 Tax=Henosepilachna vigintioctopunctata TaxID=420089 RepID=A0AAW1U466_9CUCU
MCDYSEPAMISNSEPHFTRPVFSINSQAKLGTSKIEYLSTSWSTYPIHFLQKLFDNKKKQASEQQLKLTEEKEQLQLQQIYLKFIIEKVTDSVVLSLGMMNLLFMSSKYLTNGLFRFYRMLNIKKSSPIMPNKKSGTHKDLKQRLIIERGGGLGRAGTRGGEVGRRAVILCTISSLPYQTLRHVVSGLAGQINTIVPVTMVKSCDSLRSCYASL